MWKNNLKDNNLGRKANMFLAAEEIAMQTPIKTFNFSVITFCRVFVFWCNRPKLTETKWEL